MLILCSLTIHFGMIPFSLKYNRCMNDWSCRVSISIRGLYSSSQRCLDLEQRGILKMQRNAYKTEKIWCLSVIFTCHLLCGACLKSVIWPKFAMNFVRNIFMFFSWLKSSVFLPRDIISDIMQRGMVKWCNLVMLNVNYDILAR